MTSTAALNNRDGRVAEPVRGYGMARMYHLIRSGAPHEIEVFRAQDEALRWLAS